MKWLVSVAWSKSVPYLGPPAHHPTRSWVGMIALWCCSELRDFDCQLTSTNAQSWRCMKTWQEKHIQPSPLTALITGNWCVGQLQRPMQRCHGKATFKDQLRRIYCLLSYIIPSRWYDGVQTSQVTWSSELSPWLQLGIIYVQYITRGNWQAKRWWAIKMSDLWIHNTSRLWAPWDYFNFFWFK